MLCKDLLGVIDGEVRLLIKRRPFCLNDNALRLVEPLLLLGIPHSLENVEGGIQASESRVIGHQSHSLSYTKRAVVNATFITSYN